MKSDAIKNALQRINAIEAEVKATKESLTGQIAESEARCAALKREISEAIDSMNIEEHHKLSEEYRRVSDELDLLKAKQKRINDNPLINEEEYRALVSEILTHEENCVKKTRQKASERLKELKEIHAKQAAGVQEANQILATIHKLRRGEAMMPPFYRDEDHTMTDLQFITTRPQVDRLTGEKKVM